MDRHLFLAVPIDFRIELNLISPSCLQVVCKKKKNIYIYISRRIYLKALVLKISEFELVKHVKAVTFSLSGVCDNISYLLRLYYQQYIS